MNNNYYPTETQKEVREIFEEALKKIEAHEMEKICSVQFIFTGFCPAFTLENGCKLVRKDKIDMSFSIKG